MLSIPRVRAQSEVALVEAAKVVAGVGEGPCEVSTAPAILTVAVDEKDDTFAIEGLSGVAVGLEREVRI